ncbi:MAG: hypothetical protein C5B50_28290 [Verrucomicrobia bacterium]|nr:MAG: hypothetical protein C5B50_28290 [Verrucomicrobiota bacterium]
MTLELSDLDTIKEGALKEFEERISTAGDDRQKIEGEAFRLESQLEQIYSLTAAMARREPDIAATTTLWNNLVKTCDAFAGGILRLSEQYSLLTPTYDHILDIRASAEELRALHSPP